MARQRHPVALALVVAVHGLLAVWAWHARWVDAPVAAREQWIELATFGARTDGSAAAARQSTADVDATAAQRQRRVAQQRAAPALATSEPRQRPAAVAGPSAGAAPGAAVPTDTATRPLANAPNGRAITPEAPASAPLDLGYRPSARAAGSRTTSNPALNDPRIQSHASYGERFARTLGTDNTMHEEEINGGKRFRQGTSCSEMMDMRAAGLDPFNQSYLPTPKVGKPCD